MLTTRCIARVVEFENPPEARGTFADVKERLNPFAVAKFGKVIDVIPVQATQHGIRAIYRRFDVRRFPGCHDVALRFKDRSGVGRTSAGQRGDGRVADRCVGDEVIVPSYGISTSKLGWSGTESSGSRRNIVTTDLLFEYVAYN
jgi:hypothetical protein